MSIAIIDYGSGNLRSAEKALQHAANSKTRIKVTNHPADLKAASHIVLPGVGAFADCMRGLTAIPGMRDTLEEEVGRKQKWFLGVCVGMQMLLQQGHEHGIHQGLGWIEGEVVKLDSKEGLKIPHMGWNELTIVKPNALTAGITSGNHAYFVHSYHAVCKNTPDVAATATYGQPITAIIARGNIMGTQFHPEKSQETGLALLKNFIEM